MARTALVLGPKEVTIEEILADSKYSGLNLEKEVERWEKWMIEKGAVLTDRSLRSWLDRELVRLSSTKEWDTIRPGDAMSAVRRLKAGRTEARRDVQRWAGQEDIRKANEEREFLAHCTPEQLSEWRKKHGYE